MSHRKKIWGDVCSTGEEDARPSAEDEGGGAEGQGEVRIGPAGDQPIQSKVHGGHDPGVREVPRDGGSTVAVLQGGTIRHTQVSQHFTGSSVTIIIIYFDIKILAKKFFYIDLSECSFFSGFRKSTKSSTTRSTMPTTRRT